MNDERPTRCITGFTLIEVIVVISIIAIIAAIAVPRLLGQSAREFEFAVEQVRDMLTIYAQRTSIGTKPCRIEYDPDTNEIQLKLFNAKAGDPLAGEWVADPSIFEPIDLSVDADGRTTCIAFADGEPLGDEYWWITTNPNELRQHIQIMLRQDALDLDGVLELAPHAIAPRRLDWQDQDSSVRNRVDLDGEGRGQEEW